MRLSNQICAVLLSSICLTGAVSLTASKAKADQPYIGDILTFAGGFCPSGWLRAEGQLLRVNDFPVLFSLIGSKYGGDGRFQFALPDLRGRRAMGSGAGNGLTPTDVGEFKGNEAVILTENNIPPHRHFVRATNADGDKGGPAGKLLGAAPIGGVGSETIYSTQRANRVMSPDMIEPTGLDQPFDFRIVDPALVMTRCIALDGQFPPEP